MFDFLGRLKKGARFTSAVLTGDFDESPVEQQFAAWFNEEPARSIQRDLFVRMTTGVGGPRPVVAERLIDSIMKVWRGGGAKFGDLLARQLDVLVVFRPPATAEQMEAQRVAIQGLNEVKARLRRLDEPSEQPPAQGSPVAVLNESIARLGSGIVGNLTHRCSTIMNATDALLLAECAFSEALLEPPFNDAAFEYSQAHAPQVQEILFELAEDAELATALSYLYAAKTMLLVFTSGNPFSEDAASRLGERATELGINIPSPVDICGTTDASLCIQAIANFARSYHDRASGGSE